MSAAAPAPGARHRDGTTTVTLYAPNAGRAWLELPDRDGELRPLESHADGTFALAAADLPPGTRYLLRTDRMQASRPDPASRWQPLGVHGYSVVVDDGLFDRERPYWPGRELGEMILYELHVGTFSESGTLDGAVEHLPDLVRLGINTVELMPLNQFPGERGWGYDGVYWQAVHDSYGGPEALVRFVDAAHELDLAVVIDAVFNHLGPEGNYLPEFAPYLTDKHHTPWGPAVNLDDYHSDGVRRFVLACAKTWLVDYGADGLRLDAVHALRDSSARHLLAELSDARDDWARAVDRPLTLIGECDLNDPRYITPTAQNGLGLDGQWVDEFHHALRTRLTDETRGYYADFENPDLLLRALKNAYVYTGQYSRHRGRQFGQPTTGLRADQFVVFAQNHDQVGNRARGERLHEHLSVDAYLLAAATTIWSPFTPMLWQGEEYMEQAPFPYFVSHGDPGILQATREGRIREFAPFLAEGEEVPDPGAPETFASAKLTHERSGRVYDFYREALAARRRYWPLRLRGIEAHGVAKLREGVAWQLPLRDGRRLIAVANFGLRKLPLTLLPDHYAVDEARLICATQTTNKSVPAQSAALWLTRTPEADD